MESKNGKFNCNRPARLFEKYIFILLFHLLSKGSYGEQRTLLMILVNKYMLTYIRDIRKKLIFSDKQKFYTRIGQYTLKTVLLNDV